MALSRENMIRCPGCWSWLPQTLLVTGREAVCPACRNRLDIRVFRRLFRPEQKGLAAQKIDQDGLASCYFHPRKKASVPCDRCGRFLCSLCDVDWGGQHICPACIESQLENPESLQDRSAKTTLYDRIAVGLAVLPVALVITLPLTAITAPAAVYFAVRYWNRERHPVLTPMWNILAILIALATIAGWIYMFARYFSGNRNFL